MNTVPCDIPRPLLVGFQSQDTKDKVMSKLKNLKEAEARFKGISIAHDMTPWQRIEMKRLVKQAKQDHVSTSSDGAENYWFRVVGQGTRMRVIKVKKVGSIELRNSCNNSNNGFKCLFLNVHCLRNKMYELITVI